MTSPFERTDYGAQSAGIAPVIVVIAVLMYWFRSSLWVALPAAGLALTVPAFASCMWLWWRAR